jgi:hypothetical protein
MIGCLVFKLATVALLIYSNIYNHNPPMKEHGQCLIGRAASSSTKRYLWSGCRLLLQSLLLSASHMNCSNLLFVVNQRMGIAINTNVEDPDPIGSGLFCEIQMVNDKIVKLMPF